MRLYNVACMALLAAFAEQIMHEGVHALAAILVGARVDAFHFWAVAHSFMTPPAGDLAEGIIAASAALMDILFALVGTLLIGNTKLPASFRLFLLYFSAFCLFSGFGYLLVDPLFAGPDSVGDWAKVVMLLGGDWTSRVPIALIGAAGTVYGFFWFGRTALLVELPEYPRRQGGLVSCILPYLLVCSLFSILSIWHPVGIAGTVAVMMKCWMGYIGFFWGYMIIFVWDDYLPQPDQHITVPERLQPGLALLASAALVAIIVWMSAPLPTGTY
ncbi:MAG: hypothetical protein O2868_13445 [Proteobacteria bacterium]|jgi:hypothetical protein|nr:hypothetical protein [Pseudomonadota bacterium]